MEPSAKALCLAPRSSARLQGLPPPPPPPRRWPKARCSPADAGAPCGFATLPDDVLFRVFSALPVDARARCGSVCRAWAHALVRGADAWRFWTRLDLSIRGGAFPGHFADIVALAGAAALARGRLQQLDLSYRGDVGDRDGITLDALLGVLRGNPELHELALDGVDEESYLEPDQLQELLAAAPALQRLDAEYVDCPVTASSAERLLLLRAEPPYGPLRMRFLSVNCERDPPGESIGDVSGARQFGAAVAHAWVSRLVLYQVHWHEPAALEELADALLARTCRVEELGLIHSTGLSPAYLPALARLLAGRDGAALKDVDVVRPRSLFEGASEADLKPVCAALRRTTLRDVHLFFVGLAEQGKGALRQAAAGNWRLRLKLSEPLL